jgi:pimeloyl-ACP methyl ester carboxylesterase
VVGHSNGAVVSSKVAEAIPERIRWLTYVSGVVLEHGQCLLDAAPPHYRPMFDQLAAESPDRTVTIPFDLWCSSFINDAGFDLARSTYGRLCAEGYDLMTEPVDLRQSATVNIPMSYVNLTDDVVFPPGEWGWHPRLTNRLPFRRILHMPGSHEVMFTNPEGLAEAIIEVSEPS